MKKTKRQETERRNMPKGPGEPQIFACQRFPRLRIGKTIRFEKGFLVSSDPVEQRCIAERSDEHTIRDLTSILVREAPFAKGKRVYLFCPDPNLVIEPHRVEFRNGLFSTEDPERILLIEKSPKLRTGEILEVPQSILQLAAKLAEFDTPRAAASA